LIRDTLLKQNRELHSPVIVSPYRFAGASSTGVWGSGYEGGYVDWISYVEIGTSGTAVDFGDLTYARKGSNAGFSDATRGVFCGGQKASPWSNVSDYITIATPSNATNFGNLTVTRVACSGCSDATRGIIGGGNSSSAVRQNVLDYFTTQTTGNATDFGNLTQSRMYVASCADSTRGVWHGGMT
jgi:hypothetical protein